MTHGLQRGDKIIDSAELAIDGCKADIGNLTDLFELGQNHFTNISAGNFATTALLKLQFDLLDQSFEPGLIETGLFTRTVEALQQLAAAENLTGAIAFDHRDWDRFHPFIGRKTKVAVQALTATTNAATSISGPRFKDPAVCVLAGGALHARFDFKSAPTVDSDMSLEKGV